MQDSSVSLRQPIAVGGVNAQEISFIILSFEGPDPYSLAGGLGARVTNLSQALAQQGYATHVFFVGDPHLDGYETGCGGKLHLHRWCQWISAHHPQGVYDGEDGKARDFNESIPWFVIESIVKPAISRGKRVIIMGEEWHTAEAICRISENLRWSGLSDGAVILWNANNTFGFDRINWPRLEAAATITTVSRYMKHLMWKLGVNPWVIPNGIPKHLLDGPNVESSIELGKKLNVDLLLTKVARWDPDKRWRQAVEATARLKSRGLRTLLLARGGIEPHGGEVLQYARSLGLAVRDVNRPSGGLTEYLAAIGNADGADMLNIQFPCPPELLQILYHASDAVLANSGHEPFGLVGLETMAAGGIAFTGGTGEDYAVHLHNSVILETADPAEIEAYVMHLHHNREVRARIRVAATRTARRFTWEEAIKTLIEKTAIQSTILGITPHYGAKDVVCGAEAEVDGIATPTGTSTR